MGGGGGYFTLAYSKPGKTLYTGLCQAKGGYFTLAYDSLVPLCPSTIVDVLSCLFAEKKP